MVIEYVRAPEGTIPILGPVTSGQDVKLARPTDRVIYRAIERHLQDIGDPDSIHRNESVALTEVESWLDDPRDYPLIGPARLHHRLWICEFDAKSADGSVRRRKIYLDQNHFHLGATDF
jgi:hypothetical protein